MGIQRVLLLAVCLCLAPAVHAEVITPVLSPFPGEKTHGEIFEDLFGGTFQAVGNDYTSGSQTLTRVDDSADQSFDLASWTATAKAVYSSATQGFGTVADGQLFSATGYGSAVTGSATDPDGGEEIVFKRFGSGDTPVNVTTDPSLNPAGADHVVTYSYTYRSDDSSETQVGYLLFFEDWSDTVGHSDWDYNDLVVEIRGVAVTQDGNIPEPGSIALMAAGALAILPRRRR